jgi:hypothetical protein
MREHAIPQDVVGYRFHIVGNMTLKQFLEVGAGCILGLLIYNTNLYFFIKWPMIGLCVGLGVMAAFVPFEERPFDHWIVTFFKVLYKPTKFYWRREPKIPDPFLFKPNTPQQTLTELDLNPARRARIKEYIGTLSVVQRQSELDENAAQIASVLEEFTRVQIDQTEVVGQNVRPNLVVTTHSLRSQEIPDMLEMSQVTIYEDTPFSNDPQYHLQKTALDISQVAQDIAIPQLDPTQVDAQDTSITGTYINEDGSISQMYADVTSGPLTAPTASDMAATSVNLPFPAPPTEPNKLVGMILSPTNEVLSEAIIEIIESSSGMVARAVKSNTLGQFFITTPLPNGEYVIRIEKEGYDFSALSLTLSGSVVPPLEIHSS